jgi:hypothetical protein
MLATANPFMALFKQLASAHDSARLDIAGEDRRSPHGRVHHPGRNALSSPSLSWTTESFVP